MGPLVCPRVCTAFSVANVILFSQEMKLMHGNSMNTWSVEIFLIFSIKSRKEDLLCFYLFKVSLIKAVVFGELLPGTISLCTCVHICSAQVSRAATVSLRGNLAHFLPSPPPRYLLLYFSVNSFLHAPLSIPHQLSSICYETLLPAGNLPFSSSTYKEVNQWRFGIHLWERLASGMQQQQVDFDPGRTQHIIYYGNDYSEGK